MGADQNQGPRSPTFLDAILPVIVLIGLIAMTIALFGITTIPSRITKFGPSPFLILSLLHRCTFAPTRASLSRMAFSMLAPSPMPMFGRPRRWFSAFSCIVS